MGDNAWYRSSILFDWQKNCQVIAVGLDNIAGLPLDVRLRTETDGEVVVSPFPPSTPKVVGGGDGYQVMILPVKVPPQLEKFLYAHGNLRAVRDGGNTDAEKFKLLCLDCEEWLYCGQTMTESMTLHFVPARDRFYAGKPQVEQTGFEVVCGCPGVDYNELVVFDYYGAQVAKEAT